MSTLQTKDNSKIHTYIIQKAICILKGYPIFYISLNKWNNKKGENQDALLSMRVFQVSWGLAATPGLATKWPSQAVNAAPQICPGDFPKKVLNQEFAEVFWPARQTLCQSFLCWLDYSCHEWESVCASWTLHTRWFFQTVCNFTIKKS